MISYLAAAAAPVGHSSLRPDKGPAFSRPIATHCRGQKWLDTCRGSKAVFPTDVESLAVPVILVIPISINKYSMRGPDCQVLFGKLRPVQPLVSIAGPARGIVLPRLSNGKGCIRLMQPFPPRLWGCGSAHQTGQGGDPHGEEGEISDEKQHDDTDEQERKNLLYHRGQL